MNFDMKLTNFKELLFNVNQHFVSSIVGVYYEGSIRVFTRSVLLRRKTIIIREKVSELVVHIFAMISLKMIVIQNLFRKLDNWTSKHFLIEQFVNLLVLLKVLDLYLNIIRFKSLYFFFIKEKTKKNNHASILDLKEVVFLSPIIHITDLCDKLIEVLSHHFQNVFKEDDLNRFRLIILLKHIIKYTPKLYFTKKKSIFSLNETFDKFFTRSICYFKGYSLLIFKVVHHGA